MRILMVHNRYQQRGGEDAVVEAESRLLASGGIEVLRFDADNDAIQGFIPKVRVSLGQFGVPTTAQSEFKNVLQEFRPDVVHVHNWFASLSPSIFKICRAAGVPAVHTLHNFRLLCVSAILFRDGHVCEDCIGSTLRLPGIVHACYRESRIGSAVATGAMVAHWSSGTWTRTVDRFIALSGFARNKLIEGGIPAQHIVVKPNFVSPDPEIGLGLGNYMLYAGRLTEEKGLRVLLGCWKDNPDLPQLNIAGDGPLLNEVKQAAASMSNVCFVGPKSSEDILGLMRDASALICPSQWYEGMPRVVIESFAVGTPVIASQIGCYPEMITPGETGALFPAGDPVQLRNCIRNLMQSSTLRGMRMQARRAFESHYTGERNFSQLLDIYQSVLVARNTASPSPVLALT